MRDHQLGWTLPAQPLGEAIKPEKPVKVCEFREFDSKPHRRATHHDGMEWYVYEEDCRQIKGAAQAMPASDEVAPSARPDSPVAAPPQSKWTPKVGTRAMFDAGGDWVEDDVIKVIESPIPDGMYRGGHHIVLRHLGEVIYTNDEIRPLEPISTSSDSDGWVAHDGGECMGAPVPDGTIVQVRFACGETSDSGSAERWDWSMWPGSYSIVAYRILP